LNEKLKSALWRVMRGLLLMLAGTVAGAAVGFVLYLIVSFGWELISDWLSSPAPARSRRGGDPIDGWARGAAQMFYCALFVIPCAAFGFYAGLRVALSGRVAIPDLVRETRHTIGSMTWELFRSDDVGGRCCLMLAICYWPVWWIGISMPGIEKKIGSLFLLELLIIVVATFCGVMGLRTPPRGKAIFGLIVTTCGFVTWCQILNRMGFARVFERIW